MVGAPRLHPDLATGIIRPDFAVENIGQLLTLDHGDTVGVSGPLRGADLDRSETVADGMLVCAAGRIVATGSRPGLLAAMAQAGVDQSGMGRQDVGGAAVIPAFVDPHTHLVFGRTRQDEYERRIRGESYLEIAAAGGGIMASVGDLRKRSEDELVAAGTTRMREMMAHGTATVEIKSGYGLEPAAELKILRAAGRIASNTGVRLVRTCLAAHEIPPEYRDRREDYLSLICDTILPEVAGAGLAERADVFCEPSVFNLDESRRILVRARELGMALTVHADELEPFGGAALAASLGAGSADHLIMIDPSGITALAASGTVAVLLPGTVFSLGLRTYAPARDMIAAGCAVALATDFNPGSCPILSMPLVMSIACTQMRMTPAESLAAATLNAAWALGLQNETGSLTPGKSADFVVLDGDDYRLVPYHAGHNPAAAVFLRGRRI
ncbi:imidazolonepropionase [bacterium CG_4_9_14_3_um_filter_65_15]|nr:MAG: imidazolonepropionase [bacterium CG_4_9_14_3_um_filter_65_15]